MEPIEIVKLARDKDRPTGLKYIRSIVEDFTEFHGDRRFADDKAVVSGIGRIKDIKVTAIALEKGVGTKGRIYRNFGSSNPEGYRKALRQMKLAEKFRRPIVFFIDTAGAFCGIGAEERGQGQAIAECLNEAMSLTVPVISVLTGEGGSGGALAFGVCNELWIMENAYYSVISPEGCASILWKDPKKSPDAAEALNLTSADLLRLNVADRIISEENGFSEAMSEIRQLLFDKFNEFRNMEPVEIRRHRYDKFRKIGTFLEKKA